MIKHEQEKINMHGPEIEIFQSSQLDTDMIRLVFGVKKLMKGSERMSDGLKKSNYQSRVILE